jgi:hypothetical protein
MPKRRTHFNSVGYIDIGPWWPMLLLLLIIGIA